MTYDLTLSRDIKASPSTVWRCLTEPDLLKQWFAPKPVTITRIIVEPHPGGTFKLAMQVPDHGLMDEDAGCVLLAEPDRKIVWTNALGPGFRPNSIGTGEFDFAFTAVMEITPTEDGCRYTATALHATEAGMKTHEKMGFHDGWGTTADQLAELAADALSLAGPADAPAGPADPPHGACVAETGVKATQLSYALQTRNIRIADSSFALLHWR